jgi:hypothetical protein
VAHQVCRTDDALFSQRHQRDRVSLVDRHDRDQVFAVSAGHQQIASFCYAKLRLTGKYLVDRADIAAVLR